MTKTDYRYTGSHVDNLDDGTSLEPLQKVSLTAEEAKGAHAARLLDAGLLVEITKPSAKSKEGE